MGRKYVVKVNGKMYEVEVEEVGMVQAAQPIQGTQSAQPIQASQASQPQTPPSQNTLAASAPTITEAKPIEQPTSSPTAVTGNEEKVTAPMSGVVLKVNAKPGDSVKDAQSLIVIEAMKMENEILAPRDCNVKEIFVKEGQQVEMDQLLLTVE